MNKLYINNFVEDYCELQSISKEILFSKSRKRPIVEKRMILAYFLKSRTNLTWQAIGDIMNKNHASIIHYVTKIELYLDVYPHLQRMYKSTHTLFQDYKHLIKEDINIYDKLLIDNDKLKIKIEANEKLIKQLINLENNG